MKMSPADLDALTEVLNIGIGRAASSLSRMVETRVELRVPRIELIDLDEDSSVNDSTSYNMSIVQGFDGKISGNAILGFPEESGKKLACLLNGQDSSSEISEFELAGVLTEVGNVVLNGVLGSLANLLNMPLQYQVPEFGLSTEPNGHFSKGTDETRSLLIADAEFCVNERNIHGAIVVGFQLGSLETLIETLSLLSL